jgi:hypothetical protein
MGIRLLPTHWDAAGYCLDAPEVMPAGSCTAHTWNGIVTPAQWVVIRDGAAS